MRPDDGRVPALPPAIGNEPLKISVAAIGIVLGLGLLAQPAAAHHSFAMFDNSKKVTITGTVLDFQWANPHAWLDVMGSADNGPPQKWSLEGTSPAMLGRKGWKSTDALVACSIKGEGDEQGRSDPGGDGCRKASWNAEGTREVGLTQAEDDEGDELQKK